MSYGSNYVGPASYRNLRACMVCSIVLTHTRFMQNGCPNCEQILELAGSNDAILECTSQVYEGLVTLTDPANSWVAKWQRLEGYVPGMYAVKVSGVLPEDVLATIERNGVKYIPRDGSALTEDS